MYTNCNAIVSNRVDTQMKVVTENNTIKES